MQNAEKFELYYRLLVEWNEKFNLTTVTEREKVKTLHFRDSLLGGEFIGSGARLLDVGSGAGFPALPLKIERDDLDVTMTDSVGKKVNFLQEVIKRLGLENARAIHCRIEDFKSKESFDVVTSRAVAPLNVLCEYCLPFVKVGGVMIAYKSVGIEEEIKAAERAARSLGGEEPRIETRKLSDEITRTFVIIRKAEKTPSEYPRGGNKPRIKPIV